MPLGICRGGTTSPQGARHEQVTWTRLQRSLATFTARKKGRSTQRARGHLSRATAPQQGRKEFASWHEKAPGCHPHPRISDTGKVHARISTAVAPFCFPFCSFSSWNSDSTSRARVLPAQAPPANSAAAPASPVRQVTLTIRFLFPSVTVLFLGAHDFAVMRVNRTGSFGKCSCIVSSRTAKVLVWLS